MEVLINNVKKFNPNFKLEDWCFEKLLDSSEIDNYKFYNKSRIVKEHSVYIKDVIGTLHPSYSGSLWIELVYNMKKFSEKYNYQNFLEFSRSEKLTKNDFGYSKYGSKYFIAGGNHRNVQAKFSNLELITCDVVEHIFDQEMYNLFQFLVKEKFNPLIEESGNGKYYRFSLWIIQLNSQEYYFSSFSAIVKFVDHYNKYIPSLTNNLIAKFSKRKKEVLYNENKDYIHLKNAILLHKLNKNHF
ncbi:hypothetical protein LF887_16235 [Chryseobacterium sp. MEBOG06]|uniref:hypothetical protein n=1 Tax=Chryseobacterium sp. MEBOG06 TaxID=2879938 RepID=UPI001F28E572|nr:hypothetical protein [Chryseobacterium sp. MEBOG06]UKB82553.1 hypothetical protein LF887_16235 [Chryseobacterium sp. MEBOG06]